MWQDNMREGSKTLIIAGSAHLALDIDFMNDAVQKVALSFPDSPDIVTRHTEKAGNILLQDLRIGPKESTLTKSLDQFAANLERVAALDKLSGNPGLNCHEAVAGIYESLEKLHNWEIQRAKAEPTHEKRDQGFLERVVMCTRSGRPVMHSRDRLGLSVDYWQNKRLITARGLKHEEQKTWSLLVECAPLPSLTVFPPLRVSQDWISRKIIRENAPVDIFADASQPQLDWQEPDSTIVPAKGDNMGGIEGSKEKVLDVIFMAKFDPPLIVPYAMAMTIYDSTNAPFDMYQTSTFDGLMFPNSSTDLVDGNASRTINSETTIHLPEREGVDSCTRKHKNSLFIDKIGYGRTITELPFSHPQQLVAMLPSLRKYAFLSSLLLKTFGPGLKPTPSSTEPPTTISSLADEFFKFMSNEFLVTKVFQADLTLDVMLQIESDKVRLRIVFPMCKGQADLMVQIKLNGAVEIESENILKENTSSGDGKGKPLTRDDLARALEICEDLGIWVEFMRRRLG
jgi:hypothetical protein